MIYNILKVKATFPEFFDFYKGISVSVFMDCETMETHESKTTAVRNLENYKTKIERKGRWYVITEHFVEEEETGDCIEITEFPYDEI